MVHPVIWPKKTFFYPIGNTAPSCFTRDLAPEMGADILLLGCGDPRSILYTIHSDHCPCKWLALVDIFILNKVSKADRKLDFTCCDAEPAILGLEFIHSTQTTHAEYPHKLVTSFYSPWSQMANHLSSFGVYFITFFLTTPLLDFSWPSVGNLFKFRMICKPGVHRNMAGSYAFALSTLWQKFGVIGSFTLKWKPCQLGRKIT